MLNREVMTIAVDEAHRFNKIVIAHTLTAEATKLAVEIGIDGLAHFINNYISLAFQEYYFYVAIKLGLN